MELKQQPPLRRKQQSERQICLSCLLTLCLPLTCCLLLPTPRPLPRAFCISVTQFANIQWMEDKLVEYEADALR